MAKSGRKRKREEKSKTQLKKPKTAPGRHLPKGTNETRTEFKVTQIVIPQRVGTNQQQSGPVTKKRLGLKEVLSKLGHFSQTVKSDGLEGLKELVTSDSGSALVAENLSRILEKLAPLTSDKESKVRKSAGGLLEAVLQHMPPGQLEPLHKYLCAHLCCGLSHIDASIQRSGLSLLDRLVVVAPEFVAASFDEIVPNCLQQMAKDENSAKLAGNVSDKMTAIKWRTGVVQRLHKMFKVVNDQGLAGAGSQVQPIHVKFDESKSQCFSLYQPRSGPNLPMAQIKKAETPNPLYQTKVDKIIPLLFETWLEATATGSGKKVKKSNSLSPDVFELLSSVIGLLEEIVILLKRKEAELGIKGQLLGWLKEQHLTDIRKHFIEVFPYNTAGRNCMSENLALGQIYLSLTAEPETEVTDKLLKLMKSKHADPDLLVECTKLVLAADNSAKADECIELLLKQPKENAAAVELLADLALGGQFDRELDTWLTRLPLAAFEASGRQPLQRKLFDACLQMAKKGNSSLLDEFRQLEPLISGYLDGMQEPFKTEIHRVVDFVKFYGRKLCSQ